MSDRAFMFGAIGLVLLAALVGIITIGGPTEARRERFDQRRYQDLVSIAHALQCAPKDGTPALPAELTVPLLRSYCGGRNIQDSGLLDKETNELYKYSTAGDGKFSICAKFYDAARTAQQSYYSTEKG